MGNIYNVFLLLALVIPVSSIYRGSVAKQGRFEWMAGLYEDSTFICSGALITRNYVLTAASCVTIALNTVILGDYDRGVDDGTEETRNITRKIVHPEYDSVLFLNDIALVEIDTVVPNKFIRKLDILDSTSFTRRIIEENRALRGSGWGQDYTSSGWALTDTLNEIRMIALSNEICASAGFYVTANTTCMLPKTAYQGFCDYDQGSPIVTKRQDNWVLAFIYAYRNTYDGCVQGFKGATTVANYADWIFSYTA